MSRHIGIVGCSSEGAALCYRTICLEAEPLMGRHAHPEISMHTISLAEYMNFLNGQEDWQGVAELILHSADRLKRAGADFLIPEGFPPKRLTAPVRTFVVLMAASLCAVSIFFVPAGALWGETRVGAAAAQSSTDGMAD